DYLKEKERRLEEDMLSAKEAMLKEAGEFIDKRIADLPTRQAAVQAKSEIKKEIQKVEEKQKEIKQIYEEPVDPEQFSPGKMVFISALNELGEIKTVDRVKLNAIVIVKGMEITVPISGLKIPLPQEASFPPMQKITYRKRDDVPFEVDLHGMYVEEMLPIVEKYLSDAVLADMPYVKILHGIGTGALRKALHEYLQKHPLVKKFGYGTPEEGGGGVTIVNF
ncbi:Smr/MutS family protein, partial [Candidatus Sumerlaeota bacterium]|nr:Smr/MutS family protein [Candidatus Sumerlaeota bacterium]